jgi:hypothetical protein
METAEFTAVMAAISAVIVTAQKVTDSEAEPFIANLGASTRLLREQGRHDAAERLTAWLDDAGPALLMADALKRPPPN